MNASDNDELVMITREEVKEAMCDEIAAAIKTAYGVDIFQLDRDQLHVFLQKIATANKKKNKIVKWVLYKAGEVATSKIILPVIFFGLRSAVLSYIF